MELSLPVLIASLLTLGAFCQWIAWRTELPAILYLLLAGMAIGLTLGTPGELGIADTMLFPLVSLGVAIILFEGSLTLKLEELRGLKGIIRNLLTVGVLITWAGMTLGAYAILEFAWPLALLFGAIVTVTGPTVIVPLLRSLQPSERIGNILRWEGILIDPVGALLAVLVYTAIVSGGPGHSITEFGAAIGIGLVFGLAAAFALGNVIRRHWAPEYLLNYLSLAAVLLAFSTSNALAHESGLLTVTVMGIALANMRDVNMREILDFKEHLTLVIISLMFLLLAARVDISLLTRFGLSALALLAFAQLIVRPLSVAVSSIGAGMSWKEILLLGWIAPRGIVAAAVSSLFALELTQSGVADAEMLAPAVFVIIVGTVVLGSATAKPLATFLGLAHPNAQGALILGANKVSLAIASALKSKDIPVMIADRRYEVIREARMAGIPTYFGNPMSEHADSHLNTTGLKRILILRQHPERNALAYTHFRPSFGAENIYSLDSDNAKDGHSKRQLTLALRARALFGFECSWLQLSRGLADGMEIRWTKITDDFSVDDLRNRYEADVVPLFTLNADGELKVIADEAKIDEPVPFQLLSMAPAESQPAPAKDPDTAASLSDAGNNP
ncbi:MAG: cation:proton antiporter [Lysobacterales bacterium]